MFVCRLTVPDSTAGTWGFSPVVSAQPALEGPTFFSPVAPGAPYLTALTCPSYSVGGAQRCLGRSLMTVQGGNFGTGQAKPFPDCLTA